MTNKEIDNSTDILCVIPLTRNVKNKPIRKAERKAEAARGQSAVSSTAMDRFWNEQL